jgi:hypothetical protein
VINTYITVDTEVDINPSFKEILNNNHKNMDHYFSIYMNTAENVEAEKRQHAHKVFKTSKYSTPKKDDCLEYNDIKNRISTVYTDFIENLQHQAHSRIKRNCMDLPVLHKKAEVLVADYYEHPHFEINYYTSPLMMVISLDQSGLNFTYVLSHFEHDIVMVEIKLNHNNEIILAEVGYNDKTGKGSESTVINHQQLDYLIVLSHYMHNEDIDFNIEEYIMCILQQQYENVINYFNLKDMINI